MPSRLQAKIRVYFDDLLQDNAHVLSITQTVGSSRQGHTASIKFQKIGSSNQPLWENKHFLDPFPQRTVRIEIEDRDKNPQTVFIGRITGGKIQLDPETIVVNCRLEEFMFGFKEDHRNRLALLPFNEANDTGASNYTVVDADYETIFNPYIDGEGTPNRLKTETVDDEIAFLDPQTVDFEILQQDREIVDPSTPAPIVAAWWSIPYAIKYMCDRLNPLQTYLVNPDLTTLLQEFGDDPALLRNIRIPIGSSLPEVLTALTVPFGYNWRVRYEGAGASLQTIIEPYNPEFMDSFVARLQPRGEFLDTEQSHVMKADWTVDRIDEAYNELIIVGDKTKIEMSIILYPAWDAIYDNQFNTIPFQRDSPDWIGNQNLQWAWRRFAANEAGDYTGTRPWFATLFDMVALDPEFKYHRRRAFMPTLSSLADGSAAGTTSPGVLVEYWHPATGEWKPVKGGDELTPGIEDGQCQIFKRELGLWFSGNDPPLDLIAIGRKYGMQEVKLRVTGTIETDTHLRVSQSRKFVDGKSWVDDTIHEAIAQQSHTIARIDPNSVYAAGDTVPRTRDDQVTVLQMAEDLIDKAIRCNFSGPLVLEGLDYDLTKHLGSQIRQIFTKMLDLNIDPRDGESMFPTITSIEWDPQNQNTTLNLQSFR